MGRSSRRPRVYPHVADLLVQAEARNALLVKQPLAAEPEVLSSTAAAIIN